MCRIYGIRLDNQLLLPVYLVSNRISGKSNPVFGRMPDDKKGKIIRPVYRFYLILSPALFLLVLFK
jgi:hypothetical protein